ncbi:hypothetical protein D3C76_1566560 [compost metagenome]
MLNGQRRIGDFGDVACGVVAITELLQKSLSGALGIEVRQASIGRVITAGGTHAIACPLLFYLAKGVVLDGIDQRVGDGLASPL